MPVGRSGLAALPSLRAWARAGARYRTRGIAASPASSTQPKPVTGVEVPPLRPLARCFIRFVASDGSRMFQVTGEGVRWPGP